MLDNFQVRVHKQINALPIDIHVHSQGIEVNFRLFNL
jgi:hypothetical protein